MLMYTFSSLLVGDFGSIEVEDQAAAGEERQQWSNPIGKKIQMNKIRVTMYHFQLRYSAAYTRYIDIFYIPVLYYFLIRQHSKLVV